MKSLLLIASAAALFAGLAQAQQIALRSGDHPTFSRLTFPLPDGQNWDAQRTAEGVEVTLPGFNGEFDTAAVFQRMKQNRITTVTAKQNILKVRVICDCQATAFRSGRLLVIDVADDGTPLEALALDNNTARPKKRYSTLAKQRTQREAALPWIGSPSPFNTLPVSADEPKENNNNSKSENDLSDRAALLTQAREDLVAEVATAASSGLLDQGAELQKIDPSPTMIGEQTSSIEPQELPESITSPSLNVRITSSMDLPESSTSAVHDLTAGGTVCPAGNFLAIDNWGNETGFSAQLGPKRDALMNARDQISFGAVEALAKLYIYFGFGAEALDVLQLNPAAPAEHPELITVAHILEYSEAAAFNPLTSFTDCPSDVALWATLSLREIPRGTLIDTRATLRAVNDLPKHLRQIVAPMLSARLLEYGDADAASSAMRSIERLPEPPTPDVIMAQAEIAMDAGSPASELLEKVIETNTEQSPEALVKLVKAKLSKNEPLPYEMATLVEAYAQELRGTEMGRELRRTQVTALIQANRFDQAFDAYAELAPSLSPQAGTELQHTIIEQLSSNADDPVFLEHIFAQPDSVVESLPVKTKLLLARRLMDLGFGAQVQQIITAIPDRPKSTERQLLAARAAIQLQQPFQAQAALINVDDPEAALLMAQAKEMVGAYREAYEIFASNNIQELATQAAWLSEDWRTLTPVDTPDFGPVAAMAQSPQTEDSPSLGPLGSANRALEDSAAARDTLEQLLSGTAIELTPES